MILTTQAIGGISDYLYHHNNSNNKRFWQINWNKQNVQSQSWLKDSRDILFIKQKIYDGVYKVKVLQLKIEIMMTVIKSHNSSKFRAQTFIMYLK